MNSNYTEDYLACRRAYANFLSYEDESFNRLMDADFPLAFRYSYSELLKKAENPEGELKELFENVRKAMEGLVRIHEDGYHWYPLWPENNMPKVLSCENRPEAPQACMEDGPGFVPYLVDMRLTEPEKAKGTVIISPSVRGGAGELLYPARKFNEMGYNCFGVSPRFNTAPRIPGQVSGKGFLFSYGFPEEILDVQRAIRYVKYHAAAFSIDPEKFVTLGFSKGNCAHYISSNLFDLKPGEIRFLREDGTFEQIAEGYQADEIDAVPADVSVNIFDYGDMMLTHDGKHPVIQESRIYTAENMEKGKLFPACYFVVGNRDRVSLDVAAGFLAHNAEPDRLYDIPYELHIYDGVGHGVTLGKEYPNFYSTWENADLFCEKYLNRKPEKWVNPWMR